MSNPLESADLLPEPVDVGERYGSQNSLDESSQKQAPPVTVQERPHYKNNHHTQAAFEVLNTMRKEKLLCDVVLVADNMEIPAHRAVLAVCSPHFIAMFNSFEESVRDRVTLQGVDFHALQLLVDYVYTSLTHVTEHNVQALLPAANLLQLTDVRDACCEFLQRQLKTSKVIA